MKFLILGFLLTFIVTGLLACSNPNLFKDLREKGESTNNLNNTISKDVIFHRSKEVDKYCEEKVKELIPKTLILQRNSASSDFQWTLFDNKYEIYKKSVSTYKEDIEMIERYNNLGKNAWLDVTPMIMEAPAEFKQGSKPGENINLFYYSNVFEEIDNREYGLTYKKEIITDEGEILGTRQFKIKPVLKPIEGTEQQADYWYNIKDFEIVYLNITYCDWIEG